MKKVRLVLSALFLFSFFITTQAFATLEQVKNYQAAFGGDKPKCLTCHVDKIPKKDDGKHEPNDYGKKLIAANPKPDVDTYKKVGANPDAVYSS